jgi:cyclase
MYKGWMIGCRKSGLVVLFFLAVLFPVLPSTSSDHEDAEVVQLAEHIYRVTFPYSLRTNVALSVGADGVLLVDTGFKETAEALHRLIAAMGKGEVKYIINTHRHDDHVGGNWICGKNATVVDSENLNECLSYGFIFPGNGDMEGKRGKIFGTYYSIHFNGDKLQIIPCPGIHSNTDLIAHFSNSGVVHMGDLLLTQSFPAVGMHVKEYMEFLDKTIGLFPPGTTFIAGHGCDYTLSDLERYREMLVTTIAIVRKEMNAGKTLGQIQGERVLQKWESWGEFLPFLNADTWIESIYKSFS